MLDNICKKTIMKGTITKKDYYKKLVSKFCPDYQGHLLTYNSMIM